MMRITPVIVLVLLLAAHANAAVVRTLIRTDAAGADLLKKDAWRTLSGAPHRGEQFICDNGADPAAARGFSQTVVLNQATPQPILATVSSKADNVGGSRDSDYSLYLDLVYADGQPLWGQVAPFRVATHDWQKCQVQIFPTKPIRQVTVNLLLRRHTGRAEFREPRLIQLTAAAGATWFDGLLTRPGGDEGFQARDVAADSDFQSFDKGESLGLKLEEQTRREGPVTFHTGTLTDTTGRDRAITLVYALNAPGRGWKWLASPRQELLTDPSREYLFASHFGAGANGMMSRLPLAAIANPDRAMTIALDMSRPAFFRVGYSAGVNQLYIAYDFGLTREKPTARFAFCTYDSKPADGFRGAIDRLYRIYPDQFRSRTPQQGLWMPFHKISTLEHWEDFGFKFKEGNDETAWDDAHGILTFRYTEPMTWWMRMPPELPRTPAAALAHAQRLAAQHDRNAEALLTSGYFDETGQYVAKIRREPWCDGAVWSLNSSPGIPGDVTDFKNKWNPQLRDRLYGKDRKADLDGEYIDSSEGYVTDELDFRRDHFAAVDAPLTFSAGDHRPAAFRGLIAFEYIRAIANDLHGIRKLMMANSTPDRLCFLAALLDVLGTETDWNPQGNWRPMSDEDLLYRRVLSGPKPYCFLMNTDFDRLSPDRVEKYMRRCLAYGMFPGFFSHNAAEKHYFSQPRLYNRDRDLFKKYVPLCKLVAEAGWQPITRASSSAPRVRVERFGDKYLTVFNDSPQQTQAILTFADRTVANCTELLSGRQLRVEAGQLQLTLDAEDVAVLELK